MYPNKHITREELFNLHHQTCEKAFAMMEKKNNDYCGADKNGNVSDPMKNFRGSLYFDIDPIEGILLRIGDKMQRIHTFAKTGNLAVKSESVDDAIEDAINYLILAQGLCRERQNDE